jgi:hypothetical protein
VEPTGCVAQGARVIAVAGEGSHGPGLGLGTSRAEVALCALVAAAVATAMVVLVPVGGDAAAHMYRALLVRQGVLVWDNLWFAGQYPLASYSLLYYLPAALVGNLALGAAAVVVAACLFASVLLREWGAAARWPSRSFALLASGQLFTGDFPYTAGFAALLGTLWALQRGRTWLAITAAALTLGFSPLVFLFLCLACVAVFLRSPRVSGRRLVIGSGLAGLAALQLAVLEVFPSQGLYFPYDLWRLLAGLGVAALGTALALRTSRARRTLVSLFLVWAVANLIAYLVRSPVGYNLLRPAAFVFPLMLLTALLAHGRPRWLAVAALAAAFAANVAPYLTMIPDRSTDPSAHASFWRPLLAFLDAHRQPGYRIEVVPTANHWETYYLPRAGFALARGWYSQLDVADNPALYRRRLTPALYRSWLRSVGVRYVLLPRAGTGGLEQQQREQREEATLLLSGRSGLRRVLTGPSGDIWELPRANPILTGPGRATITSLTHAKIAGWVQRPGSYLLRVHYTPYLRVAEGKVCLERAGARMIELEAAQPGPFALQALESPAAVAVKLLGDHRLRCA